MWFFLAAFVFTVVDGDTVKTQGEKIRLIGIDAPELSDAKCAFESMLAEKAKRRLAELLVSGRVEIFVGDSAGKTRDRYGRLLAKITVDDVDVGETLIREGLARPWTGRREPWC